MAHVGGRPGRTRGWRAVLSVAVGAVLAAAAAFVWIEVPHPVAASSVVWLCAPGQRHDPCKADTAATVVSASGVRSRVQPTPAATAPVDCFYVYPTVRPHHGTSMPS